MNSNLWKNQKISSFSVFDITHKKSLRTCRVFHKQSSERESYAVSWHEIEIQQVVEGLRRQNDEKSLDCFSARYQVFSNSA